MDLENSTVTLRDPDDDPIDIGPFQVVTLDLLNRCTDGGRFAVLRELDHQMSVEIGRWKGQNRELVERVMRRVMSKVLASPCAKGIVEP